MPSVLVLSVFMVSDEQKERIFFKHTKILQHTHTHIYCLVLYKALAPFYL